MFYFQKKRNFEPISEEEEIRRIRTPRNKEVLGIVTQLLGNRRMYVECKDGKKRICKVPGRYKRRMWVREGDTVLIDPWPIEGDKKGDVIWRYSRVQARYLERKGLI